MPVKNSLRLDPTRTALLRRAFAADIRGRFVSIAKDVVGLIVTEDGLGLTNHNVRWDYYLGQPATNAPSFRFDSNPKKLQGFNHWFKQQVNGKILEVSPIDGEPKNQKPWLYKYVDSAYKKGALRAYNQAQKQKQLKPVQWYHGGQEQFLESAFGRPERVDKLRMIYTRSFEDLKGITAAMSTKISRALAAGLAKGASPKAIAREMVRTISGMSKNRAELIAQTEVIHAHAEGQLDGFEDLGVGKVGVEAEFSTAGDDGVCKECKKLSGKVFTIKRARGLIPQHPRCRCSWLPVITLPKLKRKRK